METRNVKEMQANHVLGLLKDSFADKIYDNFNLTMEKMQMLVALPNENWRSEVSKSHSPLFILSPTTVQVTVQVCLVKNDPELPICKVTGSLNQIGINISGRFRD